MAGEHWEPGDPGSPPHGSEGQNFTIPLQALADEWKAEQRDRASAEDASGARRTAQSDADRANERALFKSVHDAYISVASDSLQRALQRGTFVVTAASAVVTLYTGILGVRFATGKGSQLIPARGLIPALYLGAAIALSAAYVAFLKSSTVNIALLPSGIGADVAEARLRTFLFWTTSGVLNRSWAIRSAIGALALGAATLPLPFLSISDGAAWLSELGWLLVVAFAVCWKPRPWEKQTPPEGVPVPAALR
ncbi:MAG TPA: hypothetical protein VNV83_04050 [Acidimicrobiales bacterium]|jgi:hypothetical protein|nr:hypothetical protein [Acidimicrobiales bacterium]